MAVIHISEAEAARDFAAIVAKVRAGEEIIIDDDLGAVRVARVTPRVRAHLIPIYSQPRLISEIVADLNAAPHTALIPDGFAADVEAVIQGYETERVFNPWAAS